MDDLFGLLGPVLILLGTAVFSVQMMSQSVVLDELSSWPELLSKSLGGDSGPRNPLFSGSMVSSPKDECRFGE